MQRHWWRIERGRSEGDGNGYGRGSIGIGGSVGNALADIVGKEGTAGAYQCADGDIGGVMGTDIEAAKSHGTRPKVGRKDDIPLREKKREGGGGSEGERGVTRGEGGTGDMLQANKVAMMRHPGTRTVDHLLDAHGEGGVDGEGESRLAGVVKTQPVVLECWGDRGSTCSDHGGGKREDKGVADAYPEAVGRSGTAVLQGVEHTVVDCGGVGYEERCQDRGSLYSNRCGGLDLPHNGAGAGEYHH